MTPPQELFRVRPGVIRARVPTRNNWSEHLRDKNNPCPRNTAQTRAPIFALPPSSPKTRPRLLSKPKVGVIAVEHLSRPLAEPHCRHAPRALRCRHACRDRCLGVRQARGSRSGQGRAVAPAQEGNGGADGARGAELARYQRSGGALRCPAAIPWIQHPDDPQPPASSPPASARPILTAAAKSIDVVPGNGAIVTGPAQSKLHA